ncbi:hypothetical protein H6786_05175 [Candidatus Nomurabacteria bacterium]|nr:hypothetical protein [Candidatus Nomurabacteria bacterium]
MSRSLPFNAVALYTASLLLIGSLFLQAIFPTIAYAVEDTETTEAPAAATEPETQSQTEEPPAEEVIVAPDELSEETLEELIADAPEGDSEVITGDATAGLAVTSEVNTTEVEAASTTASSTEATEPETPAFSFATQDENETTVKTENTATTTTNATTSAETGDNLVYSGSANIDTGNALAYADILNVVNTNIVNSDGLISFINDTLGYNNFDLRNDFEIAFADFDTAQSTSACTDSCNTGSQLYSNANTADITNNITVVADTGGNGAVGNEATITTGNAYASANVINVANTNISDSQYLLLIFNNFDDFAGDIVLPNSSFFDQYFTSNPAPTTINATNNNTASINNDVSVTANTGDNTAIGDEANITTGAGVASGEVTNLVNQNIIGGRSFNMLIRVHGDWTGSIDGLPEGLTWRETERGIEIISTYDTPGIPLNAGTVSNTNNASINNNVHVFALTGDNAAAGNTASISTGNAYADASIMNIANTNIIGSNWSNLIFNIYGNWNGNLSFGQTDLWLGVTATSPDDPIMPGSLVTYTFTVFNRGDTTAPNVNLEGLFAGDSLAFSEGSQQALSNGNSKQTWSLGDIGPKETREFTHVARVSSDIEPNLVSALPLTSRVSSDRTDANDRDNEEVVTVYVGRNRNESTNSRSTFPAHFEINKTASRDIAQPGDTVEYTVSFFNRGGPLFDALLVDTLENEAGEIISQQSWPLGEIKNWETINVSYEMEFDSAMATGTYTNYAQLIGFQGSRRERSQTPYESAVASHELHLGTKPAGEVLGVSTSLCEPYLTEYLRYGALNDAGQVMKLQQFLNMELDRGLLVSGYFDLATEQAVRDFQIIHRDEVLTPWGLERDSGYVYYTTQKKINDMMCAGMAIFPLAPDQQQEIESFKSRVQADRARFSFNTGTGTPAKPEEVTPPAAALPPSREADIVTEEVVTPSNPPADPPPPTNPWSTMQSWWQSLNTSRLMSMR